jgi:hypothetical protein
MAKLVYTRMCLNCLFCPQRIVSPERMNAILDDCRQKQSSFTCHTSSPGCGDEPDDVMCAGYWSQEFTQAQRDLAVIAGWVEFVERQTDMPLIGYEEQFEQRFEKKQRAKRRK